MKNIESDDQWIKGITNSAHETYNGSIQIYTMNDFRARKDGSPFFDPGCDEP